MYEFLTGPMFYISIAVFVIGLLFQAIRYIKGLDWKLDRVAYRATGSLTGWPTGRIPGPDSRGPCAR